MPAMVGKQQKVTGKGLQRLENSKKWPKKGLKSPQKIEKLMKNLMIKKSIFSDFHAQKESKTIIFSDLCIKNKLTFAEK